MKLPTWPPIQKANTDKPLIQRLSAYWIRASKPDAFQRAAIVQQTKPLSTKNSLGIEQIPFPNLEIGARSE